VIITVVTDIPNHWILPYSHKLIENLSKLNHDTTLVLNHKEIVKGDMCFFLGCGQIAKPDTLALNPYNLVVHESDLPNGRGWSPLSWQILEGKNEIPITLLEAINGPVDSGDIYIQDKLVFEGHELIDEMREAQGNKTVELAMRFVSEHLKLRKDPQNGTPTHYPKRKPEHSEIDINKSLSQIFNQLRIVDNERYPAFFYMHGKKYLVKIYKDE